jgi:hypothetical protein
MKQTALRTAALAVGRGRLPMALGLTVLVGLGWELAEATGVGHHGCLADIAPDLASALLCCGLTAAVVRAR